MGNRSHRATGASRLVLLCAVALGFLATPNVGRGELSKPLAGKKIAILVESQFIPAEIAGYKNQFGVLGAEVHLISRLWGQPQLTFVSDVEDAGKHPETISVNIDLKDVKVDDYAAVLIAANYVGVRLRYFQPPEGEAIRPDQARTAPAVRFFSQAMLNPRIVKGALCHGLWILTPRPDLLAGRRVICHEVLLSDVVNAGGVYVPSATGVVVDGDLVTGRSAGDLDKYIETIACQIQHLDSGQRLPSHAAAKRSARNGRLRVLIALSSFGFWGEELVAPMEALDEAGIEYRFATPYGHPPAVVPVSMDPEYVDPPLNKKVTSPEMAAKVKALVESGRLKDVKPVASFHVDDFDGLLLVGGSGPVMDMNNCRALHELIWQFAQSNKIVAAECYAVGALAFTRKKPFEDSERRSVLFGRKVTGHPLPHDYTTEYGYANVTSAHPFVGPAYPLEFLLRDAVGKDGKFVGNIDKEISVVVDLPFITSRSVAESAECGRQLVTHLQALAQPAESASTASTDLILGRVAHVESNKEADVLRLRLLNRQTMDVRLPRKTTNDTNNDRLWIHPLGKTDSLAKQEFLDHIAGNLIAANGLIYSNRPRELVAHEVVVMDGLRDEEPTFESPTWWSDQAGKLAGFWTHAQFGAGPRLDLRGELYRTSISKEGRKRDHATMQETATLSRLIFGLASNYLMNGDPTSLAAARELVRYQRKTMRCEAAGGKHVFWAHAVDQGKMIVPSRFKEDTGLIPLYEQIYCLAGLTQYYRITQDPDVLADIDKTMAFMNDRYWDNAPSDPMMAGYFSHLAPDTLGLDLKPEYGFNQRKKNWNSVGDHLPAYLFNLYLATGKPCHLERLRHLARLIARHFPDRESPFVQERFNERWEPDTTYWWQQNRGIVGHNLKIAWVLTQMYFLTGDALFRETAEKMLDNMGRIGQDLRRGGWYDALERRKDPISGHYEFVWHNRKAWWQQEQGILANYVFYVATTRPAYLDSARHGAAFYNSAFVDGKDEEILFAVEAAGSPFLRDDSGDKGSHSKSAYHSLELAYYAHLYTNLLVHSRPVVLHFKLDRGMGKREMRVQPVAFPRGRVCLKKVEINGVEHTDFDGDKLIVRLPDTDSELSVRATLEPH